MTDALVVGEEETLDAVCSGMSIARYGDGELNNLEGKKCVPQLMVPGLQDELKKIIAARPDGKCIVGIPYVSGRMPPEKHASWSHYIPRFRPFLNPKKKYYSAFITRPDSAPWIATKEYFDKVNSLWRDKEVALVWGGYRSLYPDFLRKTGAAKVHSVIVSYEDAYAQIDDTERRVLATGAKVVLLCAGPTATCLAYRLSVHGVHAIDLGHIGLFWRHAQQEHKDIAIAPVTVLPPVNVTKAQIKSYGACEESPRVGGLWWPRMDATPENSLLEEKRRASMLVDVVGKGQDDKVAVFVGAGVGPAVKVLSERYGRVFAFEPDFGVFGSLRRNLPKLNCKNVAFFKECVGDVVGTTRMRPSIKAGGWTVDINGQASVMQTTIDAMELEQCDLVVTDVGSYHKNVIAGAQKTIEKFKPHIVALS